MSRDDKYTPDHLSNLIGDSKVPRSKIPSRMKRRYEWVVSAEEMLKGKTRIIVITNPSNEEKEDEMMCLTSNHITVEEDGNDELVIEEDVEEAPPSLESENKPIMDELKEVNLGTVENPRPTFINAKLSPEKEVNYMELLMEYRGIFTWSYDEMPGLDPRVVVHQLAVKHGVRPVKQTQRRFCPELISQIEVEVNKLIQAGFIREVKYPTWISNIVPVKKKNGQMRVCVDFRDLNNAYPKDDFPLSITKIMVDATMGHRRLTFMDGSSGYNQIRMAPADEEKTAFQTPKGIYCYKVMPFGLKNRFQLKMNPLKCAFGVSSGKFLGFIVRH
jgi:hypothetical protein